MVAFLEAATEAIRSVPFRAAVGIIFVGVASRVAEAATGEPLAFPVRVAIGVFDVAFVWVGVRALLRQK
jgi:hypothetical protein